MSPGMVMTRSFATGRGSRVLLVSGAVLTAHAAVWLGHVVVLLLAEPVDVAGLPALLLRLLGAVAVLGLSITLLLTGLRPRERDRRAARTARLGGRSR